MTNKAARKKKGNKVPLIYVMIQDINSAIEGTSKGLINRRSVTVDTNSGSTILGIIRIFLLKSLMIRF